MPFRSQWATDFQQMELQFYLILNKKANVWALQLYFHFCADSRHKLMAERQKSLLNIYWKPNSLLFCSNLLTNKLNFCNKWRQYSGRWLWPHVSPLSVTFTTTMKTCRKLCEVRAQRWAQYCFYGFLLVWDVLVIYMNVSERLLETDEEIASKSWHQKWRSGTDGDSTLDIHVYSGSNTFTAISRVVI